MPDPIVNPANYLRAEDILTYLHKNLEIQFQAEGDKMERPAAVEHFKNREALLRVRKLLTDAAEHALKAKLKPSATDKEVVIFINDHSFGEGLLAHSIGTAIQWYGAFLENLDDGDEITVTIKRQDMTKAELDALPEI